MGRWTHKLALVTALVTALIGSTVAPAAAQEDPLPDVPVEEAVTVCAKAILIQFADDLLGKSIEELIPGGGFVLDVVEVRFDADEIVLKIQRDDDSIENVTFDLARLFTKAAKLTGPFGELFGSIGTPALYCLQAALVIDQELAKKVAVWLQAAWVATYYAGDWTGTVTQQDIEATYPVQVTIKPGSAGEEIATGSLYPTWDCTVTWTLKKITINSIVVHETVETGPDCLDTNITLTRQSDGSLDYNFEDGNGRAILHRAGG
jgi:hypothetical protein